MPRTSLMMRLDTFASSSCGSGAQPAVMKSEVSTARSADPNSGSCQFFIVQKDAHSLDNQYTIFGKVLEGMDVVDTISLVPKDHNDRPVDNVVMESVTVETR